MTATAGRRFEGKVVLVTGASSGLGRSVAERLAAEGADVCGLARDADKLAEVLNGVARVSGRAVLPISADVSSPSACRAAIAACVERFGGLDVLVNVAGSHTLRHTSEVSPDDWASDLAVNLSGPFFLLQAALPHLLERQGNVVNVASIAGLEGQAYSAPYCAAKHGLVGLTRSIALEMMDQSVRVNCVCPGGMNTPQLERFSAPDGVDFDLVLDASARRGLMEPDQVAATIAFLASDDASGIHGAVYPVDNGKMV